MFARSLLLAPRNVVLERIRYSAIEGVRTIDARLPFSKFFSHEHASLQESLERGAVLHFPHMGFDLLPQEARFLSPQWSNGKSKNINLRSPADAVRGASGDEPDLALVKQMLIRYGLFAEEAIRSLFPTYMPYCIRGGTSYRPCKITAERSSWRKDDTRLHVDAFPSNPNHGLRLLRVFTNVNPDGMARVWRTGEPFKQFAANFFSKTRRPVPGSAWLLHKLGITKSRRSAYDHLMLQLHDQVKADSTYQRTAPQQEFSFLPGATWIVFTDQVLHAAMSGQFAFEQTFYLDPQGLSNRGECPLDILEAFARRPFISSSLVRAKPYRS